MPIFEYRCPKCGARVDIHFENWKKAHETKIWCSECDSPTHMDRLISSTSFTVAGFSAKNGYSR